MSSTVWCGIPGLGEDSKKVHFSVSEQLLFLSELMIEIHILEIGELTYFFVSVCWMNINRTSGVKYLSIKYCKMFM